MQQSVKAEDPFKVGKFGIGFNSVYHITGTLLNRPFRFIRAIRSDVIINRDNLGAPALHPQRHALYLFCLQKATEFLFTESLPCLNYLGDNSGCMD